LEQEKDAQNKSKKDVSRTSTPIGEKTTLLPSPPFRSASRASSHSRPAKHSETGNGQKGDDGDDGDDDCGDDGKVVEHDSPAE
jgi:hypothetical protein